MTETGQDATAHEESQNPDGGRATQPETSLDVDTPASESDAISITPEEMRITLRKLTGYRVEDFEARFRTFMTNAQVAIGETEFFDQLTFLQSDLEGQLLLGKIRGVDVWANGDAGFKFVTKSWDSFVDKLYRVNYEDNNRGRKPPEIRTVQEQAARLSPDQAINREWITPERGHLFLDDLVRTKFVLPFADGVASASERVTVAARELGLKTYRRYHAKDSGYHAHHVYVLLPVAGPDGDTEIAFEIKILTKMQDNLGELTHLLYEFKRTGRIESKKKRALAWLFDSTDFEASYLGHSAHYIEASLVRLKAELTKIEGTDRAKS